MNDNHHSSHRNCLSRSTTERTKAILRRRETSTGAFHLRAGSRICVSHLACALDSIGRDLVRTMGMSMATSMVDLAGICRENVSRWKPWVGFTRANRRGTSTMEDVAGLANTFHCIRGWLMHTVGIRITSTVVQETSI